MTIRRKTLFFFSRHFHFQYGIKMQGIGSSSRSLIHVYRCLDVALKKRSCNDYQKVNPFFPKTFPFPIWSKGSQQTIIKDRAAILVLPHSTQCNQTEAGRRDSLVPFCKIHILAFVTVVGYKEHDQDGGSMIQVYNSLPSPPLSRHYHMVIIKIMNTRCCVPVPSCRY